MYHLPHELRDQIFNIQSEEDFNQAALQVFQYQAKNIAVYKQYLDILKVDINRVQHYRQIPFMPIQFFKTQEIITSGLEAEITFSSSGTTGMISSQHFVALIKIL